MHTGSSPTRIGLKFGHCWIKVNSNGNKKSIHWESNRWITITQEKSRKFHEWERYGYPHLFYMNWKKYSHTLGNLWKLISHIWELCGFINSIDFYSKPMVWEYISFPQNIPIAWNFALPILCGLFEFLITSNFVKNLNPGNDMAFHRIFPFCANFTFINEEEEIVNNYGPNSANTCHNLKTSHIPLHTEAGTRGVL